ncbi:acyl carrier protein [Nocardia sp. NBC_01503]|uniref:acyl carrier protein n=1 Tax=Nocardia sp. NBC_01503 TaxID=2975997 RepID=UPI002E7B1C51|nr:acyl carrier protein [Nocardia sp. NBC_01503]WTL31059.1 acyl carrier protein [Nocardia sp. NBC_01503]
MSTMQSRDTAEAVVRAALRGFATEAELSALPADEPLRRALDLDSLDFLTFIERLSVARGQRIEEDEYPRLLTIHSCVDFLTTNA